MFDANDYRILSDLVFKDGYPGYRPDVVESPNGDGQWDTEKRYAHIAEKYLHEIGPYAHNTTHVSSMYQTFGNTTQINDFNELNSYLDVAHNKALEVAIALGVPKAFWPVKKYSAMRVLEYPPGAIANPHVDFDLFTLMCYRNIPDDFRYTAGYCNGLSNANVLNKQMHFGEILELLIPEYKATEHEVTTDKLGRTQYSIVYFAIPDHAAVLPNGDTVENWLEERLSRSRKSS